MSDTRPEYKWTVMVYLAGDNNLTDECVYSLKELKKRYTDKRIKITAQFDPLGRKTPVHRYVINKDLPSGGANATTQGNGKSPKKISDDVTPVVEGKIKYPYPSANDSDQPDRLDADFQPEVNTGNPKTLFDFISWSVENFKAENYMVVLAGHGGGTEEDFLLKDENPRASLSIADLRSVFEAVKNRLRVDIGILGMDVCLMSMGEVCFEMAGLAKYVVSAEGYSATAGWPYGNIIETLDSALLTKDVSSEEFGRMIVNEYTSYYSEYMVGGFSSDMSLIDTGVETMYSLSGSVKTLTDQLIKELSKGAALKEATGKSEFLDQIILAHWEAQSYNGERFVDLYDFCDLLGQRYAKRELPPDASEAERTDRQNLRNALDGVKSKITERVVKLSCYSGIDYQYSFGLSVYFPWAEVGAHYKHLAFAIESGWSDFLDSYTEATRRVPRGYLPGSNKLWRNVERYRTGGYRTGGYRDPGQNPIYSMRNPPFTLTEAGQSSCQQKEVGMIEKLDVSFFK